MRRMVTSTAQRAESSTSVKDSSPASGHPARAAATLNPLRKLTGKPEDAINHMFLSKNLGMEQQCRGCGAAATTRPLRDPAEAQ